MMQPASFFRQGGIHTFSVMGTLFFDLEHAGGFFAFRIMQPVR